MNEQCSKILNSKRFMLDMLYSQNKEPCEEEEDEDEEGKEKGVEGKANQDAIRLPDEGEEKHPEKTESHSNVRVFAERFGDLVKGLGSPHTPLNKPPHEAPVVDQEKSRPPSPKKESDSIWDQLLASPRELRIGDIDFTDLKEEDDKNILDASPMGGSDSLCPPPPPPLNPYLPYCPPPPPMPGMRGMPPPPPFISAAPAPPTPSEPVQKSKKTIRLFWNEVGICTLLFYRDQCPQRS